MKNIKSNVIADLSMVMSSNFLTLLSSVLTGLVVPKVLGVSNYGYYKIFTLYMSYTALFHFGFIDGVLLRHGAQDYEELDKYQFRINSRFFIKFQTTLAIVLGMGSLLISNENYSFIFLMLSVYMMFTNITSYYQFISQATMRFKELSVRKVIQSVLTVFIVASLFILRQMSGQKDVSYKLYVALSVVVSIILAVWYIYTYRSITFGKAYSFGSQMENLKSYFREGIYLTIAYQISTLIFTVDSQFISIIFNRKIYGMYAFAYSLVQMVLTILNAISTVLFPHIKRQTLDEAVAFYPKAISYIIIIVYASLLGYYPVQTIIHFFLPEYVGSLEYFQILFPGVGLTCSISLVTFNYFKILNKNKLYFDLSLLVLLCSVLLNTIAYLFFGTAISIAVASLVTLLIWRISSEAYLVKNYKVKWKKNLFYTIIMTSSFLTFVQYNIESISFICYLTFYLSITIFLYYGDLLDLYRQMKK